MPSGPMNARILYWGIEGAGKTTNLEAIRAKLRSDHSGEVRREPTRIDPTVTYEVLPIQLGDVGGRPTQIEIVVIPDGEEQAPTRKQLLDEVSGVVLVVDSQPGREDANAASRDELARAFESYGRDLSEIPMIVQYNKRDLADDNQIEALHRRLALPSAAVFEAIATDGTGVLQTLTTISKRVVKTLRDDNAAAPAAEAQPQEPVAAPASEPSTDVAGDDTAGKSAPIYDPEALAQRAKAAAQSAAPPASPAAPAAAGSTTDMLEAAIEAELEGEAAGQREAASPDPAGDSLSNPLGFEMPDTFNTSYDELASADKPAGGLRLGPDLRIVSVGTAAREGERSVRIPLVLGDASGETASIALTIQLDPLLDGGDE